MPIKHVIDNLYRSGDLSQSELLSGIRAFNITKIISLDGAIGSKFDKYLPKFVEHLTIPMSVGGNSQMEAASLARYVRNGLLNNGPGNAVLVHCLRGKDRTGLAVALYNVIKKSVPCDRSINEAKYYGGFGPEIGGAASIYEMEICKNCRYNHKHYCERNNKINIEDGNITIDLNNADDVVTKMRENMSHQQGVPSAGTTAPIVNQQQSFAPYSDPTMDMYPGGVNKSSSVKNRKKLLKKLIKLLEEDVNDVEVGLIDNYNGIPDSQLNAPSGSPGAPNAAGPSDPGGLVQL